MRTIDKLYSLYIKNIIIPKTEDFSKPGYVFTRLTNKPGETILRDVFIPENLVAELETRTVEKRGEDGRKLLYAIGKNSCYTYSKFSKLDTVKTKPDKKDFEEHLRMLLLFIAGTYGADVTYEFDLETKVNVFSFSEYIVCQKNGIGEIFLSGSSTGMTAWVLQDNTIEGVQTECVGRGGKRCSILLAPPQKIRELGYIPFEVPELLDINITPEYLDYNQPKPTESSKTSLNSLIAEKTLSFNDGKIRFHNQIFFECDIHYIYILEHLHKDDDLLLKLSKDYFKQVGKEIGEKLSREYISNLLGAMGWGDITIYSKDQIYIKNYPYTSLYTQTTYPLIRGILSGLLTTLYNEDINLPKAETQLENKNFSLIIR